MKRRYYVGLSATFHDPAIAIVDSNGRVLFAEAVERSQQDKRAFHCPPDHLLRTPELLRRYCPDAEEIVAAVSFSELSWRILQVGVASDLLPLRGLFARLSAFIDAHSYHDASAWPHPTWRAMRNFQRGTLTQTGLSLFGSPAISAKVSLRRYNHHLCHAAYACESSAFRDAACAVVDGYGEFGSTSFFSYRDGKLARLHPARTPLRIERASLGIFYAMVCGLCGFEPLKGEEWKVMGLAPYGKVDAELRELFRRLIIVKGLELAPGLPLAEEKALLKELHARQRKKDAPAASAADIARTGQEVFAERMRELLQNLYARGGSQNLVVAGGCALNSAYNGKILAETPFTALHVPSAPADDGNCIGAALLAYREDHPQAPPPRQLMSPYLGTDISSETRSFLLRFNGAPRVRHLPDQFIKETARLLAQGKIIGWMQGRAEFGPRALGHRSILADPRDPDMKDRINMRVKFREEYRPFAPSVLHEHGADYFVDYQASPYMERTLVFRDEVRSRVPAVVHEDGTGRLQSVTSQHSPRYYALISAFHELTGVPMLLNTSFNIMGKPIIHTIEDAIGMFYTTGLDALVIDDILIEREASMIVSSL